MMLIKILGTRGEIEPSSPYHSHHSGILVNNQLLFDCGEKGFFKHHPDCVFITHLHPDHAYFARNPQKQYHIETPIFGPEPYQDDINVNVLKTKKKIGSITVTPIPTIHSLKVKSQAYLIERKEEKILYTGDMIWIEKQYHSLLNHLDLVITEASFIRKGGRVSRKKESGKIYGHAGIPDLLRFFQRFTRHICFVHFGSWFYKDVEAARKKLRELSKEYELHIIAGYDGMKIDTSQDL